MDIEIRTGGDIVINDIIINPEVFDEEHSVWKIEEREDLIDTLIDWISEATKDKEAMKDDLKYLIKCTDEYMFSSVATNNYVLKEDDEEEFNEACLEVINEHNLVEAGEYED